MRDSTTQIMNINNVAFSVSSVKTNHYISLLANSLRQEGLDVCEIRFADILLGTPFVTEMPYIALYPVLNCRPC